MTNLRLPRAVLPLFVAAVACVVLLSGCLNTYQLAAFKVLNEDREANHVPYAGIHGQLRNKAQAWADTLAKRGSLSHSKLSDGVFVCWRSLGENVGYGSSIREVEGAFMKSPGHRANIVNAKFNFVGTGVKWVGSRVYVVQVFMQSC